MPMLGSGFVLIQVLCYVLVAVEAGACLGSEPVQQVLISDPSPRMGVTPMSLRAHNNAKMVLDDAKKSLMSRVCQPWKLMFKMLE